MKKLLIILFLLILSVQMYSQVSYNEEENTFMVPKVTKKMLGTKYPYDIAYIWRWKEFRGEKIIEGISIHYGEDRNTFTPLGRAVGISCDVSTYNKKKEYVTYLIIASHEWRWKELQYMIKIKTNSPKPIRR